MVSLSAPARRTFKGATRSWRTLLGVGLLAALFAGCAADEAGDADAEGSAFNEGASLPIPTSASPSGGTAFTFCAQPAATSPVNLTNAAWLAMASANEYAHFGLLAPQLLSLGFGNPKGGDTHWTQCGGDEGRTGDFELAHAKEIEAAKAVGPSALVAFMRRPENQAAAGMGPCGRGFFSDVYTGRDASDAVETPAAAFRDHLLRRNSDQNWIQFYTGKPYSFIERWVGIGGTQVLLTRHATKPIVIIAFRGTESPESLSKLTARQVVDLVTDVLAWKTDLTTVGFSKGWGSAHNGWVSSLQSVDDLSVRGDDLLTSKLKVLTQQDEKVGVWLTGHSLGGAVATLMAARLLDAMDHGAKVNLRGLYTFGSPIVGNNEFADKLVERAAAHGTQIVRFRKKDDIVTSVPFSPTNQYRHAGVLGFFDNDKLDLLPKEPGYGSKNFEDHDVKGPNGYYQLIMRQRRSLVQPALDACSTP